MKDYGRELASAQAITTEAVSENTWDVDAAGKNLGNAVLYARLEVTTTFTGLDSGINIFLTDSAAAALTGDRAIAMFSSTTCSDDGVIPVGDLTEGTVLFCAFPPAIANKQYIGAAFVPVSEAASAGAVNIDIMDVCGEVDLQ